MANTRILANIHVSRNLFRHYQHATSRISRKKIRLNFENLLSIVLHPLHPAGHQRHLKELCGTNPLPSIAADDPLGATDEAQLAASSRSLNL
jgi:hypothetical protein